MMAIMEDQYYTNQIFKIDRNTNAVERVTLNEDLFVMLLMKIYCPKHLDHEKLSYEEIRQISSKFPEKPTRDPQK